MTRATTFTEEEAARILGLPASAFNELLTSGRLPVVERSGATHVAAEHLEAFLRDGLLSLYRAEAGATTAAEEPVAEVTRSIAEFTEARPAASRSNLRVAPRYKPQRPIEGKFGDVRFTILQISTSGLRIRHDETFRAGETAKLSFSIPKPSRTFTITAQAVWTSIAQRGEGPSYCISGITIIDSREQIKKAIELLRAADELELDSGQIGPTSRSTTAAPAALTSLSDDDVAAVIRAVRRFGADPVEASRWYTRARFALADEEVRKNAPARGRDREEVIGIWEFLGRRLDIKEVAGVMSWLRQTRSAAAMT